MVGKKGDLLYCCQRTHPTHTPGACMGFTSASRPAMLSSPMDDMDAYWKLPCTGGWGARGGGRVRAHHERAGREIGPQRAPTPSYVVSTRGSRLNITRGKSYRGERRIDDEDARDQRRANEESRPTYSSRSSGELRCFFMGGKKRQKVMRKTCLPSHFAST